MERLAQFEYFWYIVFSISVVILSLGTSLHAVLRKRDHRAAVMWVAFIWFSPLVGAVCYIVFGVNRIRRRAAKLKHDRERENSRRGGPGNTMFLVRGDKVPERLRELRVLGDSVTERPLLGGNFVELLENGDAAFPAMLESIRSAKCSVSLSSYIFDDDQAGKRFVAALSEVRKKVSKFACWWMTLEPGILVRQLLGFSHVLEFATLGFSRSHGFLDLRP